MRNGILSHPSYLLFLLFIPGLTNADVMSCLDTAKQSEQYVKCINTTDDKSACDKQAMEYCKNLHSDSANGTSDVILQENNTNNNAIVEPQNSGVLERNKGLGKDLKSNQPFKGNKAQTLPQLKGNTNQPHPAVKKAR